MKKSALFFIGIFAMLIVNAQTGDNIVPNPGFEEYTDCPSSYGKEGSIEANGWINYHYTPDYYNRCATFENVGVPKNFFGYQEPASGNAYVGFTVYHSSAPNEIIGVKLKTPLKKGRKYNFSMKLSLAEYYSKYASDNVGILFTNTPETALNSEVYHFKSDQVIHDFTNWTTLSGIFFADEDYDYMLIGNFFPREHTNIEAASGGGAYDASYYFIDDVYVAEMPEQVALRVFEEDLVVPEKGEKIILEQIYFDTNKSELKQESFAELTKLVKLLNNNPEIKIKISGHTDSQGRDSDNLILSQNRSKSVTDYLIENGISKERIIFSGYGETLPIATNNTPEGRAKNRRVEFEVVE